MGKSRSFFSKNRLDFQCDCITFCGWIRNAWENTNGKSVYYSFDRFWYFILLIAIGTGLYMANKPRIEQFRTAYTNNPQDFVTKEIARTAQSKKELDRVFIILPAIIMVACILIMLFPGVHWRAISVTLILTLVFLMVVDSNTQQRNKIYHEQLLQQQKQ